MSELDLVAGPITAYKMARLQRHTLAALRFRPMFASTEYGADLTEAYCPYPDAERPTLGALLSSRNRNYRPHPIPSDDCQCGFYALDHPEAATAQYGQPCGNRVLLTVELSGRVMLGSKGYRAQRQRVVGVTYGHHRAVSPPPDASLFPDHVTLSVIDAAERALVLEAESFEVSRDHWHRQTTLEVRGVPAPPPGYSDTGRTRLFLVRCGDDFEVLVEGFVVSFERVAAAQPPFYVAWNSLYDPHEPTWREAVNLRIEVTSGL